jgi:hypothetical protein
MRNTMPKLNRKTRKRPATNFTRSFLPEKRRKGRKIRGIYFVTIAAESNNPEKK